MTSGSFSCAASAFFPPLSRNRTLTSQDFSTYCNAPISPIRMANSILPVPGSIYSNLMFFPLSYGEPSPYPDSCPHGKPIKKGTLRSAVSAHAADRQVSKRQSDACNKAIAAIGPRPRKAGHRFYVFTLQNRFRGSFSGGQKWLCASVSSCSRRRVTPIKYYISRKKSSKSRKFGLHMCAFPLTFLLSRLANFHRLRYNAKA